MKPSRMIAQAIGVLSSAMAAARIGGLKEGRSVLSSKYAELKVYYTEEAPRMSPFPIYEVLERIKARSTADFLESIDLAQEQLWKMQAVYIKRGE